MQCGYSFKINKYTDYHLFKPVWSLSTYFLASYKNEQIFADVCFVLTEQVQDRHKMNRTNDWGKNLYTEKLAGTMSSFSHMTI